jgi:polar amino acid transport system substrate-binding protein
VTSRRPGRGWIAAAPVVAAAAVTMALLGWAAGPGSRAGGGSGRSATSARLAAHAASGRPAAPALTVRAGRAARPADPFCNPEASLRPLGPPAVTPGSFMAKIRARGYLIAGVDQNTYHFGYLNPLDGQIEGFDIDMLHAIAAAIFGNPDKIRFVAIADDQRIAAVQSGEVDIVAHTMTVTCARWQEVDFSTVYFDAHQRVLVPSNSTARSLADLGGQKVCATKGSTSLASIASYDSSANGVLPIPVEVTYWTDCLVLLQQGGVAAISTDDSILAGLQAQDPFTKIIGPSLADEPYGLAISKQHPDFVRFVNAVLAQMRADGQWAASYRHWVGSPAPAPPRAQYQG